MNKCNIEFMCLRLDWSNYCIFKPPDYKTHSNWLVYSQPISHINRTKQLEALRETRPQERSVKNRPISQTLFTTFTITPNLGWKA